MVIANQGGVGVPDANERAFSFCSLLPVLLNQCPTVEDVQQQHFQDRGLEEMRVRAQGATMCIP
jgi:hypothetical protein